MYKENDLDENAEIKAFNFWLRVPDDKLTVISEVLESLHNASLLIDDVEDSAKMRGGFPVAHKIYGIPLCLNAANFTYFAALKKALLLEHPLIPDIFVEQMLEFHKGQGMEVWWRENFVCPSEEEYKQMIIDKICGQFKLGVRLMQLFSRCKLNLLALISMIALLYQIRGDYANIACCSYGENKSFGEDLTEGKFSFPIIHAINTRADDTRIINILKQHTNDIELKSYCIQLLEEFGSLEYTKHVCFQLESNILDFIHEMGGNALLESFIRELMYVFNDERDENSDSYTSGVA